MAEFDELDSRLRDAFAKAAEQGDSTGVADAIRSRIAAGDSGSSVASSTAPGWGGGGVLGWLPWLGLVVLAGIGGAALGASGAVGTEQQTVEAGYTVVLDDTAPAFACPGGALVGALAAGDRVLAVARSEDSGWLGVRDPNAYQRVLWFERSVVIVDADQPDVATLPVDACPVVAVEIIPPLAVPTDEPTPVPVPGPAPGPSDTTAPSITQFSASATYIWDCAPGNQVTLSVVAADNVGVTRVDLVWTGPPGNGSAQMVKNGGQWQYTYTSPYPAFGDVTFTATAFDAAGNASGPKSVIVRTYDCPI